jgi:arylsulfatase A-like enzyme
MATLGLKIRRRILRMPAPALLLCLIALAAPAAGATKNILVVIADDFGIDSHSLYNTNPAASLPPTPTVNALAARGVRFANACAYPVCSPTRSAMLTGRYGFRTGVTTLLDLPAQQGIYTNEVTLPELLAPTHRTASFGKWHLGGGATGPNAVGGWSHFSGALQGALGMNATNFWLWTKTTNGVSRANYFGYATTDNVNDTLAWLDRQGTNRWFLWLGFNAPHTPYHLPPANLCPHYAGLSGTATDLQQNPRRYFEAAVEAMDTELGRLLAGLNTNDTAILFLGDNGTMQRVIQPPYNIDGRAKDSLYEGGVRVPFIIAGPDVASPGRVCTEVVHVVDVFATVLELAGVDAASVLPRGLPNDSRSLTPILRNEPFTPAEPAVLMEDSDPNPAGSLTGRAARLAQHKLIRWDTGAEEFYDLAVDPLEATNLLTRTPTITQQSSLDQLRARLGTWTNTPELHAPSLTGGAFIADAGWFANASLSLWRNSDLATTNWNRVTNATSQDRGDVIRLIDPQPPTAKAFYRARQE